MFNTIDEIKRANAAAGHYFFETGTMNFFNSRVASKTVYGGRYFITSEQFKSAYGDEPRCYTVREIRPNGHVETVGDFQQFRTLADAKRAAKLYAE